MLSLNANWLAAMSKSSPEVRFLATIFVATATGAKMLSGKCTQFDHPQSIIDVTPVGREIDMVTREVRTQTMSIRLVRDSLTEALVTGFGVLGARLILEWGDASLVEADFETLGEYVVQSPIVRPDHIIFPCATADDMLEKEVTGFWFGKHFLEIILDLIEKAGVPAALIDTTSFDPTQYPTTMSHLNTSRATLMSGGSSLSINEPTEARLLVDQLAMLLGGSVAAGDDGILRFAEFDSAASVVANWGDDTYADDIAFSPTVDNLINKFTVTSHPRVTRDGTLIPQSKMVGDIALSLQDDNSIDTNYATIVPGGANVDNVQEHTIDSQWINAFSFLQSSISAGATGDTLTVSGWGAHAFSGGRQPGFPDVAQPASAALSAARPGYFQIEGEILRCDTSTVSTFPVNRITYVEEGSGLDAAAISADIDVVREIDYVVAERGALGTTAKIKAHVGGPGTEIFVYDVTPHEFIADAKVDRHHDGAPTCTLRTNLAEFAVEINDLVTLNVPWMFTRTLDQIDSNTKWEILGKQIDLYGGSPGIRWVLGFATTASPPALSKAFDIRQQAGVVASMTASSLAAEDVGENHVLSGFAVTDGGGLDAVLGSGIASGITGRSAMLADTTFALTAERDAYIYWDLLTASPFLIETALAAGTPDLAQGSILLSKVVTSTGPDDIDSIDNLGPTKALDGIKLVGDSVDTAQLAADAVTNVEVLDDTLGLSNVNLENDWSDAIMVNSSLSLYTRG